MPCSRSGSSTPTGTMASNTTPRRRPASGSVFCASWRRTASRWWPLTCHSRPSAMWPSTATSFVGYRPSGTTNPLLGWGRTSALNPKFESERELRVQRGTPKSNLRKRARQQRGTFHDPRDVGGRLHNLARRYHPCRNRKWTDCCGRDVCLEQLAGHNRTFSLHNGAHQLDWISFSHPWLHAGFGCRNFGLYDLGRRAVCFVQRARGRRLALDLRDHRCCVALS